MDIWGLADEIQLLEIMYSLIESPRKVLALAKDYIGKGEKKVHILEPLYFIVVVPLWALLVCC